MFLITGDLLISGLQEKKVGPKVKVRSFPGARIKDYYSYLLPLLEKNPSNIILMAGTTDSIEKSSDEIIYELLSLKKCVRDILPDVKVIISYPTIRLDH